MVAAFVSCPVYPSEDPEKVKAAVLRLFPGTELSEEGGMLKGAVSLEHFSKVIRRQQILDTARSVFFKGIRDNSTTIRLNKQVATMGKVSFTEMRTVLGAIELTVEDGDLEAAINKIAPATVDGREVFS
jgi:uncharacterized protein